MKFSSLFRYCLFLFVGLTTRLHAQNSGEVTVPLQINAVQAEYARARGMQRSAASISDTITIPSPKGLRDNFTYDSHTPDTSLWDENYGVGGTFINRGWAIAPVNLGIATFDGLGWNGYPYTPSSNVNQSGRADELTSLAIDLSGNQISDSLYLSFWYQAEGRGYFPNPLDSFVLEFHVPSWNVNNVEGWRTIWFSQGFNPSSNDTNFNLVMLKMDDPDYFVNGFRFRFRNIASTCGSNDHWHLDDVYLNKQRTMNDTVSRWQWFVYDAPSLLANYHSVPASHFQPSMMATNFPIAIRNNEIAASNITYTYKVFDSSLSLLYSYPNAVDPNLAPYVGTGYCPVSAIASPAVSPFSYPGISGDSGYFEVRHYLKQSNSDTQVVSYRQKMYNYYAYDDGSAEVGYGLLGQYSQLAYKFTMAPSVTDTLRAIQMYFLPVLDLPNVDLREFRLTVWSHDAANNRPGSIIYQQAGETPNYMIEGPNRFVTYTIDSGLVVLNGTYYIGWVQLAPDRLYIGMDFNTNHASEIYYNTNGSWLTSSFYGSLMMRPVFGDLYDVSGIAEPTQGPEVNLYPNPVTDLVRIATDRSVGYTIYEISGREVLSEKLVDTSTIDVSGLAEGVYLIRFTDLETGLMSTKRMVIAR